MRGWTHSRYHPSLVCGVLNVSTSRVSCACRAVDHTACCASARCGYSRDCESLFVMLYAMIFGDAREIFHNNECSSKLNLIKVLWPLWNKFKYIWFLLLIYSRTYGNNNNRLRRTRNVFEADPFAVRPFKSSLFFHIVYGLK